jgi:UDPglucose 6-dehydrogenase
VNYENDLLNSVKDADCLVIVTEWPEFKTVDLNKVKSLMKKTNIVDGRNVFEVEEMKKTGFEYISIGR